MARAPPPGIEVEEKDRKRNAAQAAERAQRKRRRDEEAQELRATGGALLEKAARVARGAGRGGQRRGRGAALVSAALKP